MMFRLNPIVPFVILAGCIAMSSACGDDKKARPKTTPQGDQDPPVLPTAADTCRDTEVDIPPGYTVTSTTVGFSHDLLAPCNAASYGPDVVFRLVLENRAGVVIVANGEAGFDPILYLMQPGCDTLVGNACSDIDGSTERLEVSQLGAGEYFIIVDSTDGIGAADGGAFDLRVEIFEDGMCADDEFDRGGYGNTAETSIPLGAAEVDTSTNGPVLTACAGNDDYFLVGHLGGELGVDISGTGVTAELYIATPVTEGGVLVIDGDVVVERGALVTSLPHTAAVSAGMYLIRVSAGVAADPLGAGYTLNVTHSCLPDPYDHPLAQLDDGDAQRAVRVLDGAQPVAHGHSLCGNDMDAFLLWLTDAGELTLEVAGGAGMDVSLFALDPFDATTEELASSSFVAGDDLTVTANPTTPGTYLAIVSGGGPNTTDYSIAGTFPGSPGVCVLADTLTDRSGQVAGSTLGSPDHINTLQMHTGSGCTGGETPGPEAVYAITIAENDIVDFELESHFDAAMYVIDACTTANICFAGADDDYAVDANTESLSIPGLGYTYYLVVDSFDPLARGRFTLNWTTRTFEVPQCGNGIIEEGEECDDGQSPPQSGDGCNHLCEVEFGYFCPVADEVCSALTEVVGADSCDAAAVALPTPASQGWVVGLMVEDPHASTTDNLEGSCGGDFGPELIYTLEAAVDASYRITTGGADTFLYAYANECGSAVAEVACNDDAHSLTKGSEIEIATVGGQRYYVVLDFFSSNPGPVQLLVEWL